MNNHTDEKIGFFLCEINLYRIGDSELAVKFEVIEKSDLCDQMIYIRDRLEAIKVTRVSERFYSKKY